MRTRWTIFGLVIGVVLALGIGSAVASGPSLPQAGAAVAATGDGDNTSGWWAAMDAMHDSPGMQQMHSQMPADLQQRCNALHDQMGQWAQQHPDASLGGMMGAGSGTTGGAVSGGMMGGNTGSSGDGGMMGSGSGMMGS
jgi:hypothetical protein